jgi:multicomponent Na+:H+ antiporter subunit F
VTTITIVILALAGAGFFYRLMRGPTVADRVLAIDGLVLVGICMIAVAAMQSGEAAFLPVLVVFTLVGFVGTAAAGRFLERED